MALWQALFRRGVTDFETAFGAKAVTTAAMEQAVAKWYAMYYDDAKRPGRDAALRLPYAIVNKLCKTVFSEYEAGYKKSGSKAALLNGVLDGLNAVKVEAMQHAMIGGECLLKPVAEGVSFRFVVIQRPNYCVLGRDGDTLTSVGTCEVSYREGRKFSLLEKRTALGGGKVRLENRLYMAKAEEWLGSQVPLDSLPQYAGLQAVAVLDLGLPGVGLELLRMPMANCVDASPDGVSVYEAACGLIEAAYRLEAQFEREFENAASRVIASADMLVEREGRRAVDEDLFVALDEDPANVGITVYSPQIREQSFLGRKNDILRGIESVLGLKRGMLSEANASERTATEITASASEFNMTVTMLQRAWRQALVRTLRLCDRLGQLYLGWNAEEAGEPMVDFGDGVLFDRERVWQEYCTMVANGWLRPEAALAWYFDMPAGTPEELARIGALMPDGD